MTSLDEGYMHDIVRYIELNLKKNYTIDQLRMMLMRRDYSMSAIEKGFRIVDQKQQRSAQAPEIKKPRVVIIDSKDEPKEEKSKGQGFFSKLAGFFNKPSVQKVPKVSKDETIQIDASGNLVR